MEVVAVTIPERMMGGKGFQIPKMDGGCSSGGEGGERG